MPEPDWAALDAAWQPARTSGVLGNVTIEELVAHAAGYLPAACRVGDHFTGVDLGTGAGVPGVLLALSRGNSHWTLVDASERRCDLAEAAVRAMGLGARVVVMHARAEELSRREAYRGEVDLVVARSFGSPAEVAECGLPLLAANGELVVSVSSATEIVWRSASNSPVEFTVGECRHSPSGRFLSVTADSMPADKYPRRPSARRRVPLF